MFEFVICLGLTFNSCNYSPAMSEDQCQKALSEFTFPSIGSGMPVIAYCRKVFPRTKGERHV